MRWICSCGSVADERIEFCPTCLRLHTFVPLVERPVRARPVEVVTLSAVELMKRARQQSRPGGVWDVLFPAGLLFPCMIVLFGRPGTGKTTLALLLASAWRGHALVFPLEQGLGASLAQLVQRLEIVDVNFAVADTWSGLCNAMELYDCVVVDTIQRCAVDAWDLRAATVDCGKTLIVVSEVNAAGEVRGGLATSHVADVVVELPEFGKFCVRKNRFGECAFGEWTCDLRNVCT